MAGAKLGPLGADIRKLIREDQTKGGNPTWGTVGEEVLKLAKKHGDKRDEKKLSLVFQAHKVAIQNRIRIQRSRAERSGVPSPRTAVELKAPRSKVVASTNGSLGYFELGIKFAKEVGGLNKAIETLQVIKQVKEGI